MLEIQKWLIAHSDLSLDEKLAALRKNHGIQAKLYPDSFILRYTFSDKKDTIANECRGLHLDKSDFRVISRSFCRFFNFGEVETNFAFDEKTKVQDKLDGSLVILYYGKGQWRFRTRGTAYAEESPNGEDRFHNLIMNAAGLSNLDFGSDLDKSLSHSFELTCPQNRVVTPYAGSDLWYLASFDNETGVESDEFDDLSGLFRCRRPCEFGFSGVSEIVKAAKALPKLEEGYVAKDKNGIRVKIKNPAYVALHALRGNGILSEIKVLGLIEDGEDSEFLASFPCDRPFFDKVRAKLAKLLASILEEYAKIPHDADRKTFALAAKDNPFAPVLFAMKDGLDISEAWRNLKPNVRERMFANFGE